MRQGSEPLHPGRWRGTVRASPRHPTRAFRPGPDQRAFVPFGNQTEALPLDTTTGFARDPPRGRGPLEPNRRHMAIFSASVRTISRATGRSATAAAAYRSGTVLADARAGLVHDYTRKGGVVASFIVLPEGAAEAFRERSVLWNAAEAAEKRKDARVARELILALPHELDEEGRADLARAMAEWLAARYGVAADISIHQPDRQGDQRNHHAHILFTVRAVGADGMGAKTRQLDDHKTGPEEVQAIRLAWEAIANAALERAGVSARIDHRSHKELGIELPPQIHEGVAATQMKRRGKKIRDSVIKVDFRGREIDYPSIDQGGTRGEYNAEIISLQQYKDSLKEQEEKQAREQQTELKEEELIEKQIEALQERAGELHGDIASLEAMLNSHMLSDDMRARVRIFLERAIVMMFYRHQHETEYLRARTEAQRQKQEIEEKGRELQRLQKKVEELQERQRQIQAQYAANRELQGKVERMGQGLVLPAAGIKLEIPLTLRFEEVAMQGRVQKQPTAELLKAVLSPPPTVSKPIQAPLQLRTGVLEVKELLARSNLPKRAGADALSVKVVFTMSK